MPGIAVIIFPSVNWFKSTMESSLLQVHILFSKPGYWVVSVFWWLKCWFTWTTWHGQQPEGILSKNTFSFSCGSMGDQSWLFNTQVWKCKHSCPLVNYLKKYMTCREIWLTQNMCFILLYIFSNSFHSDKYIVNHAGDVVKKYVK